MTAVAVPAAATPAAPAAGTGTAQAVPVAPPDQPSADKIPYDVNIESTNGLNFGRAFGSLLKDKRGFAWSREAWCEDMGPGHTEVIWLVSSALDPPVVWRWTCDDDVVGYGRANPTLPPRTETIAIMACKRLNSRSRAKCSTQWFRIFSEGLPEELSAVAERLRQPVNP